MDSYAIGQATGQLIIIAFLVIIGYFIGRKIVRKIKARRKGDEKTSPY